MKAIIRALPSALLLLALAATAQADSPPPALRGVVTGGGGTIGAGGDQLTGAIGQPLAGPLGQAGGYALISGLFAGPSDGSANAPSSNLVYLPVAQR